MLHMISQLLYNYRSRQLTSLLQFYSIACCIYYRCSNVASTVSHLAAPIYRNVSILKHQIMRRECDKRSCLPINSNIWRSGADSNQFLGVNKEIETLQSGYNKLFIKLCKYSNRVVQILMFIQKPLN